MPVKTQVQVSRSSVAGARPAAGSQPVGSLYVNFPDKQLGVIDPAGNPVDLIPSGSAGDVSISTDAGNTTVLGTDGGVYTPMPTVADVGAAAVDHTHDFPVDSVNGQFGDVVLTAPDVGAATVDHDHLAADIADFGEAVDDRVGTLIQAGANVSINYDDTNNALVISSSGGGGSTPVISMDAGNQTRLGTDAGVFTPLPTPAAIGAAPTAHTHAIADVTGLQPALDGKAPTVHTHTAAQVTDFSEAVDDRVGALVKAGANMSVVYDDNANTLTLNATATPMKVSADAGNQSKLGTDAGIFTPLPTPAAIGAAPATHTHAIADVTGLQPALDGKAPTVHTHTAAQITDFAEAVDDRAAALIKAGANTTVTYDDVANTLTISASGGTAPVTSVNSKTGAVVLTATDVGAAATAHIHVIADVTGLQTALDGKAPVTHTHTTAQVTGLDAALAAKQPLDADLTAIAGLTGTSGILKKTAADTWTLDTASYALATHTHTSAQITDFAEAVDDRVGALVKAGANTTVTYDDVANTLTIGAVATAMKVSTDAGNQSTLGTDGGVYTPVPRVISANDTLPALRITQLGTGNALLVEDSTSPDATPTIITQAGQIVSGHTTTVNTDNSYGGQITPRVQTHGTITDNAALGATLWTGSGAGSQVALSKSRGTAIGTNVIVQSGDDIGAVAFNGDDGASFIVAAAISAAVDGTPGTNDMPGRLVLSTTADGAAVPTERLRINSSGAIGLAGANFGTDGQVLTSKGAALPPVWASTNSHTHTASQITDFSEAVDDRVGALIKAGTNTTVTYDDVANTLTISASGGTAPVTSVNSKTGAVVLAAADVGAAPTTHTHTSSQITDFAESVDDRVGALVKAGTNTTVTYDDVANTLTVSAATTRVIDVNDATPGLRITQQGTGDPLVVEDAASPDNSPFRVNVDGRVLIGHTQSIPTAFPMGASGEPQLQVHIPASGLYSWWAVDNSTASLTLNRSYSGQVGVHAAVPDGVILGAVSFNGSDGTAFTRSAIVRAVRDGAVGAAGVPAKLEFYTFDGVATAPNPRLVINAKGALGFGNATTNYGTAGQALLSGGSTGQPTWGANLYVMEEDLAALKQKALDVEKALTDAVTNLATTLEAAETRISSLKGLLTKANNKITDLENRLTSVETGLGITGGV
jgi:DNA-binding ferritin-like protein